MIVENVLPGKAVDVSGAVVACLRNGCEWRFFFSGEAKQFFVSGRQTKMLFTLHVVRGFL